MTDDLDRLVESIDTEDPSPEFIAELRAKIVAKTTPPVTAARGDAADLVMAPGERPADGRPPSSRRWMPIGMVAAAIALVVGLVVVGSGGNDEPVPLDQPRPTTTIGDAVLPVPGAFLADATPLTAEFAPVDPDTYRVDTLGTPFSITVDDDVWVQPNRQGRVVLSHPRSQIGGDRDIVFIRLSELSDPTRPHVVPTDPGAGWPADDFAGWLDNVTDDVVITDRGETTLGGLAATRADLRVDRPECVGSERCVMFGWNHLVLGKDLVNGFEYRVWVVDQGDEDALAVIAGISRDDDREWFDTADRLLSTLAFGDVGPNPMLTAGPGPAELPFLGGIRVEFPEESFAVREPNGFDSVELFELAGDTKFLAGLTDLEGVALVAIDDVVAALDEVADVTEVEPAEVGGVEARVFDVDPSGSEPVLVADDGSGPVWRVPARARIWLIAHPQRGLLMVSAEADENAPVVFPLALDQTGTIVESMEFVDGG